MRGDSFFGCKTLYLRAFSGLWVAMLILAGCVDYGYPLVANAQQSSAGYKYFTLTRDGSGHYRNGRPTDPGDTAVYQYAFRYSDLVQINPDLEVAARQLIEARRGAPPECILGFRVVRIIRGENGGVAANIECEKAEK